MKKAFLILSVAVAILIIILVIMGIFSLLSKSKITETKTFSEIPGFSFEYPVFKDWEVGGAMKINDSEFNIVNSSVDQKNKKFNDIVFVNIGVKKEADSNYQWGPRPSINPNSVSYYPIAYDKRQNGSLVFFNTEEKYVVVIKPTFQGLSMGIRNDRLRDAVANKIIETFKFE